MSRIFDALRKSEVEAGKHAFDSPEAFFEKSGKKQELLPVATEHIQLRREHRIVVRTEPYSPASERFRLLRTYLQDLQLGGNLKVLLVTSALPGDGKTTVAMNLATVLGEKKGCKVLLLEADLRRPSLITQFGLERCEGLAECLQNDLDPLRCIRRIEPLGIHVMPAGNPAANPMELLQSDRYSRLIQLLVPKFDWIVIDCPPAIPVADTLALKRTADATLLVVRAGQTPRQAVDDAINSFTPPGHIIGIILNSADRLESLYTDYYRQLPPASADSEFAE